MGLTKRGGKCKVVLQKENRGWQPMYKGENEEKIIILPNSSQERKKRWTDFKWSTSSAIVGAVSASLIIAIISWFFGIFSLPGDVKTLQSDIDTVKTNTIPSLEHDISDLKNDISTDQTELSTDIRQLGGRIDTLYLLLVKSLDLEASKEYSTQIATGMGNRDSILQDRGPTIVHVVAHTSDGTEYTTTELSDLKLLLPYKDGSKNGYFYGQFNENNHWDGNCVVNIYNHGKLELITDAEYNDGKVLNCRQVFPDFTTNGRPIWVISDRVVENGVSHGETWHYFRNEDFFQISEPQNVEEKDILTVDRFKEFLNADVEGYYYGTTSKGKFNDTSGDAYMIKYFENGLIRTLYVGAFENGLFNDISGNAWMIGKNTDSQAAYSYYMGPFEDGEYTGNKSCWREPLSQQEIDEIITNSKIGFNEELLRWHFPNI